MARTKEFDPDAVLDRALELFWQRDYEATSMTDLVERLGIVRASIYATFGGKQQFFAKALRRYLDTTDPKVTAVLSRPGPVLPATMNARFDGKVVLITGGAGAIAGATAQAFAERGATVVLAARDPEQAAEAAARVRPGDGTIDWVAADVPAARVSAPAEVAAANDHVPPPRDPAA